MQTDTDPTVRAHDRLRWFRAEGFGRPFPSDPLYRALLVLVLGHGEAIIDAGDPQAILQAIDALEGAEEALA